MFYNSLRAKCLSKTQRDSTLAFRGPEPVLVSGITGTGHAGSFIDSKRHLRKLDMVGQLVFPKGSFVVLPKDIGYLQRNFGCTSFWEVYTTKIKFKHLPSSVDDFKNKKRSVPKQNHPNS